ncbi:hypothetical protein POVWA2_042670 [Plasmodium ovale wallikeri]|uniref:Uncharacterized protein n=1 Tax=Plasmodium ovale wallikeri TaxID=864142 RepID=A0A1A8ZCE2_PLAOA|nr:hypothetical protein POVWA1_044070 [Plasmodium ovale wallikeri]SBT41905.1 hypothetical protein POVWA2_042670 [Plasmodium ovale wallikeri]
MGECVCDVFPCLCLTQACSRGTVREESSFTTHNPCSFVPTLLHVRISISPFMFFPLLRFPLVTKAVEKHLREDFGGAQTSDPSKAACKSA